jgi:outer membrane protein assembly factor BamB/outer membrane protein assembly factor BamD (BamD/ComL family)
MATLEVHDGRGRVEHITISRGNPALIGSDPKCDVVINDSRVKAFHGRLRWKSDHFKVEATPEARFLDVNGRKVVSASFRQGDAIQLGGYKLLLLSEDDAPVERRGAAAVQTKRATSAGGQNLDWLREMEVEAPSLEESSKRRRGRRAAVARTEPIEATADAVGKEALADELEIIEPPRPAKTSGLKGALKKLGTGAAPGSERLVSSPLILGLLVILGILLLAGYSLWQVVRKHQADRQYLIAMQTYDERDYQTAIALFDTFLETNPHDLRAGKVAVLRELANVRRFTSPGGNAWPTAIEAANQMLEKVSGEAEYPDSRMDLAAEVLKATEGLAENARASADAAVLAEAQQALALHEKIAAQAAKTLREKAKVPEKLAAAETAVVKARVRRESLDAMKKAVAEAKPETVFDGRDALVARYPDLADDADVTEQLEAASELVRKAASYDASTRPAETEPHPDPLGPPVSIVLRQAPPGATAEKATPDGPLIYALAQGFAYALDGSVGAPLWHVPVGLTSPYPPIAVAGDPPSILVFDARFNDLVRLEGRTGKLIWRQSLGETVHAPPLVLGNQVVQVLPSGKLLFIALGSGELRGTLDLGRPLSGSPAADEAGQHFYLTADRDCVFVVSREPVECVSAVYCGHKAGSVRAAPARLANYLIVPQNDELWQGRWSVFRIESGGERLRRLQTASVPGWTWQTPASQGAVVWSLTDRNAITSFTMGPDDAAEPLTTLASTVADQRPSGPAFARARGDRELWISAVRIGRFDLDAERGSLTPNWTIERVGPAAGPIQTAGRLAVFTHQWEEGPGTSLWGVDPASGKVVWKTVVGAAWPLSPSPSPDGQELTTLATDGPRSVLTANLLRDGGFLEQPLRRPGYFHLPPGPLRRLEREGLTILVPAPEADHLLVREGATGDFRRIDLPAPLGAAPVFWGDDLFAPGLDGRAYLIDPATGAPRAEPYVPTFEATKSTRWLAPIFLASGSVVLADTSGKVRRLARLTEPRLRLAEVGEPVDLMSTIEADPAPTTDAVVVSTSDGRVRSLAARDLSPLGAWNLEIPRAFGPATIEEKHVLLVDKGGGIFLFGPDGSRVWVADLGDAPPAGQPIVKDGAIWLLSRDGVLQKRALADGSPLDRVDLISLPAGGLWSVGSYVVVAAAPGSVRLVRQEAPSAAP